MTQRKSNEADQPQGGGLQIDRRKEGEHRGAGVGPSDRCQRSAHRNKARGNQRRKHHRNGGGALAYSAKSEPSQRCTPRAGDEALRTTAHGAAGQAFEARAYAVDAVEEEDEGREEERNREVLAGHPSSPSAAESRASRVDRVAQAE